MKNTIFRVVADDQSYEFVGMRFEGGPLTGNLEARADVVYVKPYFEGAGSARVVGGLFSRDALFSQIATLAGRVKYDTSFDADRVLVGRFTFMELKAYGMVDQQDGRRSDVLNVNEGTLFLHLLGPIPVVLTPGPNHFVEVVPPPQWMLGGLEVKRYRVEKPDA